MARVSTLDKEDVSEELQTMFQRIEDHGGKILNLFKTVAHCPAIGPQFLRLGNAILLKGSLPPHLRELAILRVGRLAQADYEVTQHIPIGRRAGLTDEQIEALAHWRETSCFGAQARAVLQYTDEVTQQTRASEETFQAVKKILSEEQIVELTLVVGYYGMVCRVLETLQVDLDK